MSDLYGFAPTNTLTGATFDILKMDAVEDPLIDVNRLATLDFEESHSYFQDAVAFIKEANNYYTASKIKLYDAISEATSEVVVLESFSDFFVTIKNIIKKFLEFIKSIFQRFINYLFSLVGSDKYINKHKKELDQFRSTDEFTIQGYNYTFSHAIPSPDAALKFNTELFEDLYDSANRMVNNSDVEFSLAGMKTISEIDDLEKKCDEFRADVLNMAKTSGISESDFGQELFEIFRDGDSDTSEIECTVSYVSSAKRRYFDYKNQKKECERQRKAVEDAYKQVQKKVEDLTKSNGGITTDAFTKKLIAADITGAGNFTVNADAKSKTNDGLMSAEFLTTFDIYMKKKVDLIQAYSNIHALAYSAKLDALKDCYKQDRAVLYTALGKIMRTDSKREV